MKIQNKYKNKKYVIAAITLSILCVIAIAIYAIAKNSSPSATDGSSEYINKPISGGIDYSGPTPADQEYNKQQEQKNKEREELDKQLPAKTAEVTVTDSAQYGDTIEVRAYIANLYEKDGTCTATFTKSGQQNVSVKKTALLDAKTIQCGALDIERSQFSQSGEWQMQVSYESATAKGISESRKVEIK